jgi:hypothetical protein
VLDVDLAIEEKMTRCQAVSAQLTEYTNLRHDRVKITNLHRAGPRWHHSLDELTEILAAV